MIKTFEFTIQDATSGRQFTPDKIDEKVNGWLSEQKSVFIKDIKINVLDIETKVGKTVKMIYTLIYELSGIRVDTNIKAHR